MLSSKYSLYTSNNLCAKGTETFKISLDFLDFPKGMASVLLLGMQEVEHFYAETVCCLFSLGRGNTLVL